MAESKFRSHLWIPEGEVENIPKKLQGRENDYGLSFEEHGSKLSQGLVDILNLYKRIENSDSLSDEDMIAFTVILQEKEDFKDQKDFIEEEGMKINGVKDKTHAIVTAPRDVFNNLQKRVKTYQEKGRKKAFQYIAGFEPYKGVDKQTASLLRYIKENPEVLSVDVQMMVLPDIEPEKQERIKEKLLRKIAECEGTVQGEPYYLSDGTPIIRALLSPSGVDSLAVDQGIYRIEQTAFFQLTAPSAVSPFGKGLQLEPSVNVDDLPLVVVLDNGVDLPDGIGRLAPIHWQATGCIKGSDFGNHGTAVASKVVFQNLGMQMPEPYLTPRARIIDAQILDQHDTPSNIVIARVREAVETFSPVSSIFNCSFNDNSKAIEGDEVSFLGCELDLLSRKYGVKFVISSGNHQLGFSQHSLQDIIEDDDARIAEPADAMLGITVGAIVGQDHAGSLSQTNDVAPYARIGPGFRGFYKPDLVAYGATQFQNGVVPPDLFSLCMSKTGYCAMAGTSFTAPVVAGDLAQITASLPNHDVNLAQALLYNGAIPVYDRKNVTQELIDMAGNLYGRGLSSPENSMYSSENKVTFVHTGTMNRVTKQRIRFHMPSYLADLKVKRGEKKARVTVTCIAQPPIDRTKGSEYSAAYIRASIYRKNSKGKLVIDNPVSDNRTKWDTCYHFSGPYSAFESGDWEVRLELFTRWGIEDDDEIPYALAVTIEDLTESNNLYTEIIREAGARFRPVTTQRITVR